MTKIEQTVIDLVRAKTNVEVESLDQNLRDDLDMDSLDIVEMIIDIDKEFGVNTPDELWEAAAVQTVRDVANVVTEFLSKSNT